MLKQALILYVSLHHANATLHNQTLPNYTSKLVLTKTLQKGRETREARTERSLGSARLAVLEAVGFSIGLMTGGRTRGVKPNRMAEAYPELQALLKQRAKSNEI